MRLLQRDYEANAFDGEYYSDYYARQGKNYFYTKLKPLADLKTLAQEDYTDWDHTETFVTEIGIGECAGVVIDLVATTLTEAQDKISWAKEALEDGRWADAIYHGYNVLITGAKGGLMMKDINTNTQHGIVSDFDKNFLGEDGFHAQEGDFKTLVFSINKNEPSEEFAQAFIGQAESFIAKIKDFRERQIELNGLPELQELAIAKDS